MGQDIRRRNQSAEALHLIRYAQFSASQGSDEERISLVAKQNGVSIQSVRTSIRKVQESKIRCSTEMMETSIRDVVVSTMPALRDTIERMLSAKQIIEVPDARTGRRKAIEVDDKTVQLEAVKASISLISAVQPKAPPVAVNVNQNNLTSLSSAETMEERMSRLRRQAEEENRRPPEIAGVPDSIDRDEYPDEDEDEDDFEDEEE